MNKVFLLLLLVSVVAFVGCETARGAGKDLENTGKNIKETIEKND